VALDRRIDRGSRDRAQDEAALPGLAMGQPRHVNAAWRVERSEYQRLVYDGPGTEGLALRVIREALVRMSDALNGHVPHDALYLVERHDDRRCSLLTAVLESERAPDAAMAAAQLHADDGADPAVWLQVPIGETRHAVVVHAPEGGRHQPAAEFVAALTAPLARLLGERAGGGDGHAGSEDPFEAMMQTIAAALDIRVVFARLSEIAGGVLPHDQLTLTLHEQNGRVVRHASSHPTRGIFFSERRQRNTLRMLRGGPA
jgi:hypothetical protein